MIEDFIRYVTSERRLSPLTARNYRADVERLESFVVGRGNSCAFDPTLLTPDDIRAWIVSLSEDDKLRAATINRMVCSVRAFYKFLRKKGCVKSDPFIRISALKSPKRLPVYIPESKMEHVVEQMEIDSGAEDFISQRNSLILLLFYSTGIRLAELIAIRTTDLSGDLSELRVVGKGDKERIVPLMESVRREIINYIERIKSENICFTDENFLFLTEKGKHISRTEVYRAVRESLSKAGVSGKRSPHVLRHTFATHLLSEGADMREIQELLGHTSLRATQVYTHNSITKLKEVYKEAHPRASYNNNKIEED